MNNLSPSLRDVEQTNQAMLVLGGLSAQSYRETGILQFRVPEVVDSSESVLTRMDDEPELNNTGHDLKSALKLWRPETFSVQDTFTSVGALSLPESTEWSGARFAPAVAQGSMDLNAVQHDPVFSDIASGSIANMASQTESTADTALVDAPSELSIGGFIALLIEQVRSSSAPAQPELDGDNQAEARRLIGDGVRDLGEESGAGLREVFGGRFQRLTEDTLDSLGVEPLSDALAPASSIDFYEDSAVLLRSTASSLSAVSIPRIGPLLADPAVELGRYFN